MKMMLINYPRLSLADVEDVYNDTFMVVHNNIKNGRIHAHRTWKSYILGIGKKIASKKNRRNFNMEYSRRRIRYDQWQKKIHHWSHSSSDSCHLGMDFALNICK
jgi:hypothetical protein